MRFPLPRRGVCIAAVAALSAGLVTGVILVHWEKWNSQVSKFPKSQEEQPDNESDERNGDTFRPPETVKVYIATYGCSHNVADSETMAGLVRSGGYVLVDNEKDCEVAILNSCTVKNPSQDNLISQVRRLKALGKKIIVGGCVPQADRFIPELSDVSLMGVAQLEHTLDAVNEILKGNRVVSLQQGTLPALSLPRIRRNQLVEIVPINSGCLGACTYCKTRQARGKLNSYPIQEILDRIHRAIGEGVQQIWLTSEDLGAYGLDIGANIAQLLEKLLEMLRMNASSSRVMVRLGMCNPPYMMAHIDAIAKFLRSEFFFEFLHIPVQSGANRVLDAMNREYSREDFDTLCAGMRERVPRVSIATDIICGFPSETEEEHNTTLDMLLKYKFPVVNISQFYPRPNTPAALMRRVPTQIVKRRSGEMTSAFNSYTTFDNFVGCLLTVWFSSTSDRSNHTIGHTKQYVKVLVERDDKLLGKCGSVLIENSSKWHLVGRVANLVSYA